MNEDIVVEITLDAEDIDNEINQAVENEIVKACLLYTSPSPRDGLLSRMPSSA